MSSIGDHPRLFCAVSRDKRFLFLPSRQLEKFLFGADFFGASDPPRKRRIEVDSSSDDDDEDEPVVKQEADDGDEVGLPGDKFGDRLLGKASKKKKRKAAWEDHDDKTTL